MPGFEEFPRNPTDDEQLNALIDSHIAADLESLQVAVETLAIATDEKLIEALLLSERRLTFLRGVVAAHEDPSLIKRIGSIDKQDKT